MKLLWYLRWDVSRHFSDIGDGDTMICMISGCDIFQPVIHIMAKDDLFGIFVISQVARCFSISHWCTVLSEWSLKYKIVSPLLEKARHLSFVATTTKRTLLKHAFALTMQNFIRNYKFMQDYCYCKIFLERNKLVVPKLFSLSCMCRTVAAGVTCVVKLEQFMKLQLEQIKH